MMYAASARCLVLSLIWLFSSLALRSAEVLPSVLVCGGSMMSGSHFADTTLPVMRQHFAGCKRLILVLHATHPDERDKMEARLQEAFAHLGVPGAQSLHHRDVAGQRELLQSADGIFIGGGETFVLLAELYRTGQLELIRERVKAGVPYGGTSAGANVAGLLIGTTNDFPVAEIPSRTALGLVPFVINPHHPLPALKADYDGRVGKIKIYLQFNPADSVLALGNTSIARLAQGRLVFAVGSGWIYSRSGVRTLAEGETILETSPKS
ncbi:MAG: Type 1 glutamine amidotransferase-like domain-containing protein [Opitutus sp.]